MMIRLNSARAADDLRSALEEADCVTERKAEDTLEVEFPWTEAHADARQARLELTFFVRAWAAQHPGASALVEA